MLKFSSHFYPTWNDPWRLGMTFEPFFPNCAIYEMHPVEKVKDLTWSMHSTLPDLVSIVSTDNLTAQIHFTYPGLCIRHTMVYAFNSARSSLNHLHWQSDSENSCLSVCMRLRIHLRIRLRIHLCIHMHIHLRIHLRTHLRIHVRIHLCIRLRPTPALPKISVLIDN